MSDHEWEPFGPRPTGPSGPAGPGGRPGFPGGPGDFGGFGGFGAGAGSGSAVEGPGHDAAGAYVLGILDDAEASAFEAHLAGCALCAAHLDEFAGMEPVLAMLAEAPAGAPGARPVPYVPEPPAPRLLDRLVDEVAVKRARRRRRGMYLVAAAAALIIGGPVVAVVATGGGSGSNQAADPHPTSPAEDAFFHHMSEKVEAIDPTTKVDATVGMEKKAWGTHAVLELKNVKGPQKCSLIAVSKSGEEEVVTSWSVPKWGYGIKDSAHPAARYPLYVHGGAAMDRADIDHFEVRTFDGERLVDIEA
ncbi:zf-HC2 domain-containing protein [Streptomyces sp. NPDC058231]|uniref:zf-HC2 domain-containing protein n=1 Tax=Streptomyces sp. NPDC058231 TaxID=3346392 RepID=UPI0036EA632F